MSAKYTPGPWGYHVAQTHPSAKTYSYEISTPEFDVASATPHVGIRRQPDARLMAAAPDLLEALEALIDVASDYPKMEEFASPEMRMAREAIAKAKGEA